LKWNVFDCSMVTLQLFEEITWRFAYLFSNGDSDFFSVSFLRVLKVLRLIRIIRLVRVLHFVSELRALVWSVANSLQSLGWTVILMFFIIYLVGVYFTQLVSDHWPDEGPAEDDILNLRFGSLIRTLLSLFQAISGGLDWDALVSPLNDRVSPLAGFCFTIYIGFAVLALLNVVTGVFVDSALKSVAKDTESVLVNRLTEFFSQADTDDSGTMTTEEFDSMCEDDSVRRQFEAIDLDLSEAKGLFLMLDVDDDGVVDKEEFIQGCLRLRGPAQAMDLSTMMLDAQRNFLRTQEALKRIEDYERLSLVLGRTSAERCCNSEQKSSCATTTICSPMQDKEDNPPRSESPVRMTFSSEEIDV